MNRKSFQKFSIKGNFRLSIAGETKPIGPEKAGQLLAEAILEVETKVNGQMQNGFHIGFEMVPDVAISEGKDIPTEEAIIMIERKKTPKLGGFGG